MTASGQPDAGRVCTCGLENTPGWHPFDASFKHKPECALLASSLPSQGAGVVKRTYRISEEAIRRIIEARVQGWAALSGWADLVYAHVSDDLNLILERDHDLLEARLADALAIIDDLRARGVSCSAPAPAEKVGPLKMSLTPRITETVEGGVYRDHRNDYWLRRDGRYLLLTLAQAEHIEPVKLAAPAPAVSEEECDAIRESKGFAEALRAFAPQEDGREVMWNEARDKHHALIRAVLAAGRMP